MMMMACIRVRRILSRQLVEEEGKEDGLDEQQEGLCCGGETQSTQTFDFGHYIVTLCNRENCAAKLHFKSSQVKEVNFVKPVAGRLLLFSL